MIDEPKNFLCSIDHLGRRLIDPRRPRLANLNAPCPTLQSLGYRAFGEIDPTANPLVLFGPLEHLKYPFEHPTCGLASPDNNPSLGIR